MVDSRACVEKRCYTLRCTQLGSPAEWQQDVCCRMHPPDLESAVETIRNVKEQELVDPSTSPDSGAADTLAKFLLLHVDAEQVRATSVNALDGPGHPPLHHHPIWAVTSATVPRQPSCQLVWGVSNARPRMLMAQGTERLHTQGQHASQRNALQPAVLAHCNATARITCHRSCETPNRCRRTVQLLAGTIYAPRTSSSRCLRKTLRSTSWSFRPFKQSPTSLCGITTSMLSSAGTKGRWGTLLTQAAITTPQRCSTPASMASSGTF